MEPEDQEILDEVRCMTEDLLRTGWYKVNSAELNRLGAAFKARHPQRLGYLIDVVFMDVALLTVQKSLGGLLCDLADHVELLDLGGTRHLIDKAPFLPAFWRDRTLPAIEEAARTARWESPDLEEAWAGIRAFLRRIAHYVRKEQLPDAETLAEEYGCLPPGWPTIVPGLLQDLAETWPR